MYEKIDLHQVPDYSSFEMLIVFLTRIKSTKHISGFA